MVYGRSLVLTARPETGSYGSSQCAGGDKYADIPSVSCYTDSSFQQHEWESHGVCASSDPDQFFSTVCSLSSTPLSIMAKGKAKGKTLAALADDLTSAGFYVYDRNAGNDQLALSVCAGSDLVWKLASPSQFGPGFLKTNVSRQTLFRSAIKSLHKQLLFQCHPDFFSAFPLKQSANQRAIQELNEALERVAVRQQDLTVSLWNRNGAMVKDWTVGPSAAKSLPRLRREDRLLAGWLLSLKELCIALKVDVSQTDLSVLEDRPKDPPIPREKRFDSVLNIRDLDALLASQSSSSRAVPSQTERYPLLHFHPSLTARQRQHARQHLSLLRGILAADIPVMVAQTSADDNRILILAWDFDRDLAATQTRIREKEAAIRASFSAGSAAR
ncbi:hypothetical protein HDV03_005035 [Kappamyces sp. JEL0829]|nr:hypothetical protein HDV03_005035 [Kappamyces sp. JEL0829]